MITLEELRLMANNEAVYDHLTYMQDTAREVIDIQNQPGNEVRVKNLYFINDDGEHEEPGHVWFGCHFDRGDHRCYGGNAYTMQVGCLYPVYLPTGERMRMPNLRNVSCYYDGERLSHFYRE